MNVFLKEIVEDQTKFTQNVSEKEHEVDLGTENYLIKKINNTFFVDSDSILFVTAQLYTQTNRFDLAKSAWYKLLERNSRNELARLRLGMLYLQEGNKPRALDLWGQISTDMISYLINQGDYYFGNGDRQIALEHYQLAESLQFNNVKIELSLRIILTHIYLGNQEDVLARLKTVINRSDFDEIMNGVKRLQGSVPSVPVWLFVAVADFYQHHYNDTLAEKTLITGIQSYPGPILYAQLGAFYCNKARYSEGIEILTKSKSYGIQYYALQSRQYLSTCLCQAGFKDEAIVEAQELTHIAPKDSKFAAWDLESSGYCTN